MERLNVEDFIGKKYNRLTIIEKAETSDKRTWVTCECDCGNKKDILLSYVKRGTTMSCGCYRLELAKKMLTKHGLCENNRVKNPDYRVWAGIKSRCYNENHHAFKNYGGRGIVMCKEWKDSFEAFYNDMGTRPSIEYSIEREDVNGNYCKENCSWILKSKQSQNRRNIKQFEYNGEKKCLSEWCRVLNLNSSMMQERIRLGKIPFEDAILLPFSKHYSKWKREQRVTGK